MSQMDMFYGLMKNTLNVPGMRSYGLEFKNNFDSSYFLNRKIIKCAYCHKPFTVPIKQKIKNKKGLRVCKKCHNKLINTLRTEKVYKEIQELLAKEQGIELIHIWEDMWKEKKDIVKSILSARLGILKNRIYARDCVIRNIDNIVYMEFCIKNHIQGYRQASVRLGLYHNGELVQIASFSKSKNKKYEWEWVRGCPASNNIAIGGTSKLFSHFINIYNPDSVLCYADMNLFNGNGYSKCGFQSKGYTVPDKFYIKGYKRIMRNPAKYKEYMTLVKQNHLLLCYGAGSLIYTWTKNNEIQKS